MSDVKRMMEQMREDSRRNEIYGKLDKKPKNKKEEEEWRDAVADSASFLLSDLEQIKNARS